MDFYYFLAPSSINVSVVSGRTGSSKAWREKNFSGSFSFKEIYNERPVYKVCFILLRNICDSESDAFYFSAG